MGDEKLFAEWFWIDRWMRSSAFLLPMETQGVYRAMLSQAWLRGARLPNDQEAIQRAIGCTSKEWARCWPKLERFWRVVDGYLVNDTQMEVYAEAKERQGRSISRAQAGAQARWNGQRRQEVKTTPMQSPPISDLRSPIREKFISPGNLSVEDQTGEKAGRFLENYVRIYAEERNGAHFQLKPALHFMVACQLVQGWPDEQRLEAMFRTFCRLPNTEKMAWPGTPAQFLHLAPEIDAKLRAAGV